MIGVNHHLNHYSTLPCSPLRDMIQPTLKDPGPLLVRRFKAPHVVDLRALLPPWTGRDLLMQTRNVLLG